MAENMGNIKRKASIAALALCALTALIITLLLSGAASEPAAEGFVIGEISELGDFVAFEKTENGLWLVTGTRTAGSVLKLDPDTGEIISRRDMELPVYKAVSFGSSLFVFAENGDEITVFEFSDESDIANEVNYPVSTSELTLHTITENGICFVPISAPNSVESISSSGERESLSFENDVEFLELSPSGELYLYADNSLLRAEDGSFSSLSPLDYHVCPTKLLGSGYFIDADGLLCKASVTVDALLECSSAYKYELTAMTRDSAGIMLSQSSSQAAAFSFDGSSSGAFSVDGKLLGLSSVGALFENGGSFRYAKYDFIVPEPTPTPEPDMYEGDGWLIEPQLGIIEVRQGFDAADLLKLFRPAAEMVYTQEGVGIVSGKLATGMTLADYDIVIRGDCSGNGEVNSTDIKLLQGVITGTGELTGIYRTAADVDADGELTTADLVLMDKLRR